MYKLLRRISSSFTGRPDRTRDDDATSNVPQTGSKRRMSDDDEEATGSLSKRSRAHGSSRPEESESETTTPKHEDSTSAPALPRKETEEVRQVTKGVKEVELEDKKGKGKEVVNDVPEDEVEAESIVEKSESSPYVGERKLEDIPEGEKEDSAEPVLGDAKEGETLEPSKDDVLTSAVISSDTPEVPSESKSTPEESAATPVDTTEVTGPTTATPLADEQVTIAEPAPVTESLDSRTSDVTLAKAQEQE